MQNVIKHQPGNSYNFWAVLMCFVAGSEMLTERVECVILSLNIIKKCTCNDILFNQN